MDSIKKYVAEAIGTFTLTLFGCGSAAIAGSSHQRQIQNVAQAIMTGGRPAITGEDAMKPLAIVLAVYRSAQEGHAVKL